MESNSKMPFTCTRVPLSPHLRNWLHWELYEHPRSIGFKKNWERLIHTKGYSLDERGRLHPQEAPDSENHAAALPANDIQRHKTESFFSFQLNVTGK